MSSHNYELISAIFEHPDLSSPARLVGVYIAQSRNARSNRCTPYASRIAIACKLGLSTVRRCIKELASAGVIAITRVFGGGHCLHNQYWFDGAEHPKVVTLRSTVVVPIREGGSPVAGGGVVPQREGGGPAAGPLPTEKATEKATRAGARATFETACTRAEPGRSRHSPIAAPPVAALLQGLLSELRCGSA